MRRQTGLALLICLSAIGVAHAQGSQPSKELRDLMAKHKLLKGEERYQSAAQLGIQFRSIERDRPDQRQHRIMPYWNEARSIARQLRSPSLESEIILSMFVRYLQLEEADSSTMYLIEIQRLARESQDHKAEFNALRCESDMFEHRGAYDSALAVTNRMLSHARKRGEFIDEITAHNHRSNLYKLKKEYQLAIEEEKQSIALMKKKGGLDNLGHGLGNHYERLTDLYQQLGEVDSAMAAYQSYFETVLQSKDRQHVASVTLRIGNMYAGFEQYRQAIPYFFQSQKILEELRRQRLSEGESYVYQTTIDVGMVQGNMAYAYERLNELDSSKFWYKSALHNFDSISYAPSQASVNFLLGRVLFKQQQYDSAYALISRAAGLAKAPKGNQALQFRTPIYISQIHLKWGQRDIALPHALNALKRAIELTQADSNLATRFREDYLLLADALHKLERPSEALSVLEIFERLQVRALDMKKNSKTPAMLNRFELKSRQSQIDLLNLQNELEEQHQTRQYYYLAGGTLLLLLVLLITWTWMRRGRERKHQNQRLLEENQQVEQQNAELENASAELKTALDQLQAQQRLLAQRQQQIDVSLHYARSIQGQLLGDTRWLDDVFSGTLLFFKPRDEVSGDFYWWRSAGGMLHAAVIDCTGHGVPGALMSVMAFHLFEEWIEHSPEGSPAECLNHLNASIRRALKQHRSETALDGMDLAYLQIDPMTGKLRYAGARRPLHIRRAGEWLKLDETRKSIGGRSDDSVQFQTLSLVLRDGDRLFAFTDGVADQFGGPRKRKLGSEALLQRLAEYDSITLAQAQPLFARFFDEWRGTLPQLDDALLLGLEFQRKEAAP